MRHPTLLGLTEDCIVTDTTSFIDSGSHNSFGIPVSPSDIDDLDDAQDNIDITFLDKCANDAWEVGSADKGGAPVGWLITSST